MRKELTLMALAGGIGGASSNLLDMARHFTNPTPLSLGILYLVGTFIYFLLGAAVAVIFQETDSKKAFFLGIGLPALIAAAATTNGPVSQQQLLVSQSHALFRLPELIVTAHAQTPDKSIQSKPDSTATAKVGKEQSSQDEASPSLKVITVLPRGDESAVGAYKIWFYDTAGNVVGSSSVPNSSHSATIKVPPSATKFGIWNDKVTQRLWALPSTSKPGLEIQITPERTYSNDLLRALGNRNLKPYEMAIEAKAPGPT